MNDIVIDMKLFGVLRKFGDSQSFSVPAGSTVSEVKAIFQAKLNSGLVADSVLANASAILSDNDVLQDDAQLSILPPVCGG